MISTRTCWSWRPIHPRHTWASVPINSVAVSPRTPTHILAEHAAEFAAGSMLPKITAACDFARQTHNPAVIGQLSDIEALVAGTAGTTISTDASGVVTTPTTKED